MESEERRAAQRGTSQSTDYEAHALKMLTQANCSSTPTLLATKTTTQPSSMWVRGGLLGFILMTKLPGQQIEEIDALDSREREELRQSFKKAWM